VEKLARGELPVHEPALDALFARVRGSMTFSTDPAALGGCPLVVVARDVPTDAANTSDPAVVLEAIDAALPHLRQDVIMALMRQVPPGFTRRLAARIRARRPEPRLELYYWIGTV